ncbi:MAG: TlpA disulfide reductase family protein [Acidobacteria bacterium]|nr:TlpA disulfide reductase family protein [Acidobacteriota bacterium]
MKRFVVAVVAAVLIYGGARLRAQELSEAEQDHLRQALSEAGSSPVEFLRALEVHLKKFPGSPKKPELERALVKAAIEAKDNTRIIRYGERVLAREAGDALILERVTRALLNDSGRESSEKALKYARDYENALNQLQQKSRGEDPREQARLAEELERSLASALVFQARATGNLGRAEEAVSLARKSFSAYPGAEAARETAKWALAAGHADEAVRCYADAFTIPDSRAVEADRGRDRERMGEAYRKAHGSEKGLGDLVLEAYDRNRALVDEGGKLALASLRGKVIVMDFWATWCGPCRAQHPLYEEVKKKFGNREDVVFLGINTDEDRGLVAPFLKQQQWSGKRVYYEDGLSSILRVSSIPTTVIVNRKGEIVSRLNGFLPERFVDMLSERIERTLSE